ncbi:aldo/keto reductase [Curtobacterium sp. MCPF17_050]|uniref:aldo/keto reductase n=1 Tax=Curtobacterium sp. MCPF17_050 TaxID=2175664 RepID=UPI000D84FCA5|nr:aldo/keto reductase [Curtobacterium sp. MCPF17_050]WIB15159.1 aldo/keto reductase [Curtobacterium sp. MCPF17_050]
MDYRLLGNSGTVVSSLTLGTMTFGSEADEPTSHAIIDAFVAGGGTFIDTADVYSGNDSERIIGRWLRDHPTDAQQVVLTTKGRFPQGDGPNDLGLSRRHLRVALDASLERLGVDHIDLYQMHAWDALTPIEETLRFLDDAVSAGKIGSYGFSNYLGYQVTKAVYEARLHDWAPPVTLQPQYNLLVRDIEHEVVPACLDAGIGLLPWSPLAGGWLSGKYQRDEAPTGSTRLGEDPKRGMEAWEARNADERTWKVLDAVSAVADAHGASRSQVALAWLLARPAVTSVLLGARTVEQLQDNLGAADLVLDQAELQTLTEASAPRIDDYPYGTAGVAQRERKTTGGR